MTSKSEISIREGREALESTIVCEHGVRSADSKGRLREEAACEIRTDFQRDIDRITHSKAFRRLKHKTQVFLQPEGDHYRTRLTHTLEVARIARTAARALMLNEDLTEAIALGHDLGHTPFGHAGERALNEIYVGGFRHYEQSLRVVDVIEKDGRGLNLCYETRMGILSHKTGEPKTSAEADLVRIADRIAYINHDFDDAVRAGILVKGEEPMVVRTRLGLKNSERIDAIVCDLISNSVGGEISLSYDVAEAVTEFRDFMFARVYKDPGAKGEESKVRDIILGIWEHYIKHADSLPPEYRLIAEREGLERAVADYVSGMTDVYAVDMFKNIFIPSAWSVK